MIEKFKAYEIEHKADKRKFVNEEFFKNKLENIFPILSIFTGSNGNFTIMEAFDKMQLSL